jgi:hypothetical protein
MTPIKQWGSIMVAFILNAIYRQFLRSSLPGMRKHQLLRWLAAGEPRIWPFVQFCQIRQAIYRKLLGIALPSRREAFEISANFPSWIRNSLGIKGALQLVGVQNTVNDVIHC